MSRSTGFSPNSGEWAGDGQRGTTAVGWACRIAVWIALLIAFWIAPVGAEESQFPLHGGGGGDTAVNLNCGEDGVLVGISGTSGQWINQMSARCVKVNGDGTWSGGVFTTVQRGRDPGGTSFSVTCLPNFAVNRIGGVTGGYVNFLTLMCGRLRAGGTIDAPSIPLAFVGAGGNQSFGPEVCPSNKPGKALRGKSGLWIDSIRFVCHAADRPAVQIQIAPTLVFPRWNSTDAGGSYGAAGSWAVRLLPVANATRYQICVRDSGSQNCYFDQTLDASAGFTYPDGSLQYGVTIPADRQATISEWRARACNIVNQCGPWANIERFTVVPNAPALSAPAINQAIANTRTVTFTWQANTTANAGYQLIIWRTPGPSDYNVYNPTAVLPGPNQSIQLLPAGTTSYTYTLAPGLTAVQWGVTACAIFTDKGRRCSLGFQPHGFSVPAFFGFALAPTFRHDRCKNCHAVGADNFAKDTATDLSRGLPSNHTTETANINCANCHTNALLPSAGTINPGWHAAPAAMDFRNRTDIQLCTMAQNAGSVAGSVLNHLTQDKLILWAVGDGRRPENSTPYPTAPPNTITTWQNLIQSWVNAGRPCS